MSPIANIKSCLEAPCLSMLKQTRSPDVANCSNFHLVWVSWWALVAPSQQVGGKLIILRIWKKLSQPKSVQFWIPMGMPSWQVQKNLGVCLAVWRLGGCLCLQKVGFLKVPFFTLKSGFLAILTPLLL